MPSCHWFSSSDCCFLLFFFLPGLSWCFMQPHQGSRDTMVTMGLNSAFATYQLLEGNKLLCFWFVCWRYWMNEHKASRAMSGLWNHSEGILLPLLPFLSPLFCHHWWDWDTTRRTEVWGHDLVRLPITSYATRNKKDPGLDTKDFKGKEGRKPPSQASTVNSVITNCVPLSDGHNHLLPSFSKCECLAQTLCSVQC